MTEQSIINGSKTLIVFIFETEIRNVYEKFDFIERTILN